MNNTSKQKILIIDSRDCLGIAAGFRSRFERNGFEVTLSSDDADKGTDVIPLLREQKFDLILFFCSEVYVWEDARWAVPTFDWSILGFKKTSLNVATPLIAVVTAPDNETISRFEEIGVMQLIDRGDKPTARYVVETAFEQLKASELPVA